MNEGSISSESGSPARPEWIACILIGLGCFGLGGLALCMHFFEEWGFRGGEGPLPALALLALVGVPGFLLAVGTLVVRLVRRGFPSIPGPPTIAWVSVSLLYLFLAAWVGARG